MNTHAFAFRPILVAACVVFVSLGFDTSAEQPLRIEQNGAAHELHWESENGTTSFLQHSPDLSNWQYTLHYHVGDGSARTQTLGEDLRPEGEGPDFYRLLLHPTNPEDPDDTDGDGLPNIFELGHGYVPVLTDSDGNGTPDGDEDLDDDGDSNVTEISNGTDADDSSSNSGEDPDEDGLTNKEESAIGTDPDVADTDQDGIIDSEDGWPLCKELAPERLSKPKYAVICVKKLEGNQALRQFDINNNAHAILKVGNISHYYKADATGDPLIELPSSYLNSWGGTDYYAYKSLNEANYFLRTPASRDNGNLYFKGDLLVALASPESLPHDIGGFGNFDDPDGYPLTVSMTGQSYGTGSSQEYVDNSNDYTQYSYGQIGHTAPILWSIAGQPSQLSQAITHRFEPNGTGIGGGYALQGGRYGSGTFLEKIDKLNNNNIGLASQKVINEYWYTVYPDSSGGTINTNFGAWFNSAFSLLLEDHDGVLSPILHTTHLSNNNTVMAGHGSEILIWLDQTAGLQNDQPVTATPNLKKISWLDTWGPAPPINLNAQMQGFESNGSKIWHNSLWLDVADIIPATEWKNIQIKDINDHGMLAAQATDAAGTKCAVFLVPVDIVPDYNRDGKIDAEDRGKVTEENPWRWWINDDDDHTVEERGNNDRDFPKQDSAVRDCNDLVIDGMRDLIDFFPLHLNLKQALKIMPEDKYKYVLKHKEEALKFWEYPACVADGSLEGHEPNRYLKVVGVARALKAKELKLASIQGSELSSVMLQRAKEGKGVVVVEGAKKSEKLLILEIIKKSDNSSAAEIKFPICIVDVEDMYRRVNLRAHRGGSGGATSQTSASPDYPDTLTNGKYFAYIHGFNVSGESAQGSGSNVFKRMHQLGSKARYIALSWFGNPDAPIASAPTPDYHRATSNAFYTGEILNDSLDFTHGSELTIAAHSLGNMVISHAISHHGLQPVNYIMIDGAVGIQAYDSTQEYGSSFTGPNDKMEARMVEDDWKPYGTHLYSTNWHELFPSNDARNSLTWKDYFSTDLNGDLSSAVLNVAYNFYSRGDDVVENPGTSEQLGDQIRDNLWTLIPGGVHVTAAFARHAWVNQEIAKGGQNILAGGLFHHLNGGWRFNFFHSAPPSGYFALREPFYVPRERMYTVAEAATITNAQLRQKPFFAPFLFPDLHDPAKGSAEAAKIEVKYKTLASGIPASSYAIACNAIDKLNFDDGATRNYNIEALFKNGWIENPGSEGDDWLHSDFKDVTFTYVYPMYKKMVDLGELNKN